MAGKRKKIRKTALDNANYVSVEKLAEILACSEDTILRCIHDGTLPALKIGRVYRIDKNIVLSSLTAKAAKGR